MRIKKVDANQPDIVDALEAIGALVWVIGYPFDLLVRYDRKWFVLEVKNRMGKNKNTPAQVIDLMKIASKEGVQDAVRTVYTPADALRAVGAKK